MPSLEQASAWYSAADAVHGFDHIWRVYHLAQRIARVEGADLRIVSAAALLHDVNAEQAVADEKQQKKNLEESRVEHHKTATIFALEVLQEEAWQAGDIQAVQHCIRSHRFRDISEQPRTLEAQVLFDADKLDAIGAIGVARAIAYAAKAGAPAFCQPSPTFMATGKLEAGEQHSAYHEYLFKLKKIRSRLYTITGKNLAEARHRGMVDFFEELKAESLGEA
jgi:uncharacterized protein